MQIYANAGRWRAVLLAMVSRGAGGVLGPASASCTGPATLPDSEPKMAGL